MIKIDQFGGIVPLLSPERLPDNGAQTAKNCDLTSSAIVPINVEEPYEAMHDGVNLLPGIPWADVKTITKPEAPSVNSRAWIANNLSSLISHIYARI